MSTNINEEAEKAQPESAFDVKQDATFHEAINHLHRNEPAKARTLLEPLLESNPNDVEVILNLAGAYVMLEDYAGARTLLEPTAAANPTVVNLWINLGAARLGPLADSSREEQDGAIAAYEQALAADPNAPNVHYMLGLIHMTRKDSLRAAAHLTRALEQAPDDPHVQRLLQAAGREAARDSAKKD